MTVQSTLLSIHEIEILVYNGCLNSKSGKELNNTERNMTHTENNQTYKTTNSIVKI